MISGISRNKLLLLVSAIVIVAIPIFFYFLSQSSKITVANNSNNYVLKYRNSELLNSYLETWGLWKDNAVQIYGNPRRYTIKRIKIETTDQEQPLFQVIDDKNQFKVLQSANQFVDRNGTLVIRLHNDPTFIGNSNDRITKITFYALLYIIYADTHSTIPRIEQVQFVQDAIDNFYLRPEEIPFSATRRV